ncbi:MAG: bifunctional precorrin-2 dehydrogenase/sirohydrochlorin ferrochelatase [Peptococcaceae bacterium]|nr:bifunctional precorrin-2 dehydrogenase/sirohydrochlorin ferrochelatase [Peptococcaceae bacterium]
MAFDYPVMLDLTDKPVLVVGGGSVAERKCTALVKSGAQVTVIAPSLTEKLEQMAAGSELDVIRRAFAQEDLQALEPFIVFAATSEDAVNREIAALCQERGILVNNITSPEAGNFAVMSAIHRPDYAVAISTYGKGPGFSRALREYLEPVLDEELDVVVSLYLDCRKWLADTEPDSAKRVRKLRSLQLTTILALTKGIGSYDKQLERVKEWLSYSLD